MQSSQERTVSLSLKDLKKSHYDEVDWTLLLNRLMFNKNSTSRITEDQMVVTKPSYIAKLKDLMTKTPPKIVANLLGFDIILNALDVLSEDADEDADADAEANCVNVLRHATLFHKAAEAVYANKYFSKKHKNKARVVVDKSTSAMKLLLDNIKWMDTTTKSMAIEKVQSMISYIGYDDEVFDKDKMKIYHDSFLEDMEPTSFIKNQESKYT